MQKSRDNLEKTLGLVRAKLDSSCVEEVLYRSSSDRCQLGLRFFIWAGLQSSYRHSTYMYSKACKLLKIDQNPQTLIGVMESYRAEKCLVSIKMFKVVLNLCREAKLASEALSLVRKMDEFNVRPDTVVYNVVIRLFSEKGDMNVAADLMREMDLFELYPDMITYIAMIKGFCSVGRLEEAFELFKVMKEKGLAPNFVVYSALLDGICRFGNVEKALEFLRQMEKEGGNLSPNVIAYTSVIQGFCQKGRQMEALAILDRMEDYGCVPNRVTVAILIKGLCEEGFLEEAYKLIDRVVASGGVSRGECYSSLVVCLLRVKRVEEAERHFRKMLASGVKPDGLSSSIMLKELCSQGRVLDGFLLYDEIEKMDLYVSIDSDIYSILLAGLCERNHSVEAASLRRLMVKRGIQLKNPYEEKIIEFL